MSTIPRQQTAILPGLPFKGQAPELVYQHLDEWQEKDRQQAAHIRFSKRFYANEDVAAVAAHAYGQYANTGRASPYPGLPSPASITAMSDDLIAATAGLLNGENRVTGVLTSGGTESAILALRAACADYNQRYSGNRNGPLEVIAGWSAHPCIDKAADLMGLRLIRVPLGQDRTIDIAAVEAALTPQTVMIYGSFPSYPFGLCDNIAGLGALAKPGNIWLHVDSSMAGYLAPFMKMNGERIPDFDFSVPGVCSLSADMHKHGYAAKGVATLMFDTSRKIEKAGFEYGDFPLPPMVTTTLAGTSAGAPIASAWAVFQYLGIEGYRRLADELAETRNALCAAVRSVKGFDVLGGPLFSVLTIVSDCYDIKQVYHLTAKQGWFFLPTANPEGLQLNFSVGDGDLAQELADTLEAIGDTLK